MDLSELTVETFEPLIGDTFTITAEPTTVGLVLASVRALSEWPGGRQPFGLDFLGPREPVLPQAIYRLEHAELGVLEIFVVPIGRDADGTRYEAIFT
jgi:hypothetical protein